MLVDGVAKTFRTVTTNRVTPVERAATRPILIVHLVPAVLPAAHDQPAALLAALKTELTGTLSVITTPEASCRPSLR
jgi:hypothetical protein